MGRPDTSVRERVQRAIAERVDASEQTLLELEHADDLTRLTTFASGWFRGLAAALEEIALEIDQLRGPEEALEPPAGGEVPRLDERLEEAEALQERAERDAPHGADETDRPEGS